MGRFHICLVFVLAAAFLPFVSSETCSSEDLKFTCVCPGPCVSMASSCHCAGGYANNQFALFGDLGKDSAKGVFGVDNFVDGGLNVYF
jgi:hypothetical protein